MSWPMCVFDYTVLGKLASCKMALPDLLLTCQLTFVYEKPNSVPRYTSLALLLKTIKI